MPLRLPRVAVTFALAVMLAGAGINASRAQDLPSRSQFLGEIHRAPDGSIVADPDTPAPPPPQRQQAPAQASSPATAAKPAPAMAAKPAPAGAAKAVESKPPPPPPPPAAAPTPQKPSVATTTSPEGLDGASCKVIDWQPGFDEAACHKAMAAARTAKP